MRGLILSVFSVACILFFSIVLFFSDNLMMFWLFLELATLGLIPSFFLYSDSGTLGGLFGYMIVSGMSSSLIVCGLLFEDLLTFLVLGLLIKFGLFPFLGWVYTVMVSSNWLVVWGLSTILKSAFLFFSFFLSGGNNLFLVEVCCISTFLFLGFFFWVCTYSWFYYWCHVMLSSSASLVMMSVEISSDLLLYLFLIYVFWATLVILLLSGFDGMDVPTGGFYFLLVFLLVSFPGSLAIFYKLSISLCMYSCGFMAFLSWIFYNISEQFYLISYLIGYGVPRSEWKGCVLV